jgi:hypothetical protein
MFSWIIFGGGCFPLVEVRGTLLCTLILESRLAQEPPTMEWTTPQHEEIDLNCEISSYANAEL